MARIVVCLVGLLGAGLGHAQSPAEKDLEGLQGKWHVVALTYLGNNIEGVDKQNILLDVKGKKLTLNVKTEFAIVDLGAEITPKSLDLKGEGNRLFEGIYELKDGTWRICLNSRSEGVKERPNSFSTVENTHWTYLELKRQ